MGKRIAYETCKLTEGRHTDRHHEQDADLELNKQINMHKVVRLTGKLTHMKRISN